MVGGEQEHLPFRQAQQEGSLHVFNMCTVMSRSRSLPTGLSDVQLPSVVLVRTWRRQVRLDLACIKLLDRALTINRHVWLGSSRRPSVSAL